MSVQIPSSKLVDLGLVRPVQGKNEAKVALELMKYIPPRMIEPQPDLDGVYTPDFRVAGRFIIECASHKTNIYGRREEDIQEFVNTYPSYEFHLIGGNSEYGSFDQDTMDDYPCDFSWDYENVKNMVDAMYWTLKEERKI